MAKIIHTGGGTFVDAEPIAAPEGTKDDPDVHVYAYARFRSLEHVAYGLYRTTGGPEDEEIDSEKVGEYGMEPIATYWELKYALDEIEKESERAERGQGSFTKNPRWMFEEQPYVEVTSEQEYDEVLEVLGIDPEDSAWEKPGLYDFRNDPPDFAWTVEDYELEEMTDAADQAIEFMFQGDEWEEAYQALAEAEED